MENTKQAALDWVNSGKLCTYRYGLAYRGAEARKIGISEWDSMSYVGLSMKKSLALNLMNFTLVL